MAQKNTLVISSADQLLEARTRRDFLKVLGVGGVMVLLPTALAACGDNNAVTGPRPGSGNALTIDFANGDFAVLQFAYALEQLEADFYTKAVAQFGSSGLSAAEQATLADIKNHEIIHREFLKAALGATYGFTITTTYPAVNFSSRSSVLGTAATFEDLGVAAYNGAAQYISSTDYLTLAGKIVSVEARHASAIHDLIAPKTSAFAPKTFDDAFSPTKVAGMAQGYIVDKLAFANAPSTFVQGPNNNG
ncbi:MAG: ferritin-like domain-containing protein [Gemmatimonadota bacterium]